VVGTFRKSCASDGGAADGDRLHHSPPPRFHHHATVDRSLHVEMTLPRHFHSFHDVSVVAWKRLRIVCGKHFSFQLSAATPEPVGGVLRMPLVSRRPSAVGARLPQPSTHSSRSRCTSPQPNAQRDSGVSSAGRVAPLGQPYGLPPAAWTLDGPSAGPQGPPTPTTAKGMDHEFMDSERTSPRFARLPQQPRAGF